MTLAGSENYGGGVFNEVTYTSAHMIANNFVFSSAKVRAIPGSAGIKKSCPGEGQDSDKN